MESGARIKNLILFWGRNGGPKGSHNIEKGNCETGNIIRRIMLTNVTNLLYIVSKNTKTQDILMKS